MPITAITLPNICPQILKPLLPNVMLPINEVNEEGWSGQGLLQRKTGKELRIRQVMFYLHKLGEHERNQYLPTRRK